MVNNNNFPSYQDTVYFMQCMEKAQKNGCEVDKGFIEIFEDDLSGLRERGHNPRQVFELRQRLESIATKIFSKIDAKQVQRPLMDKQSTLKSLAKTYDSGDVKKGLETLDTQYKLRRIKGDGHCMFRAIAAGMLYHLKNGKDINDAIPKELADFLAENKDASVESLIGNTRLSNKLVHILRKIAVRGTENNEGAINAAIVDYGSYKNYKLKMVDMAKAEMGGNAELNVLADVLGLKFHILHASAIGKGEPMDAEHHFIGGNGEDISLLYRPGHYDLLIPK